MILGNIPKVKLVIASHNLGGSLTLVGLDNAIIMSWNDCQCSHKHPRAWTASYNDHNSNGCNSTSLESWSNARNNTVQINRFPPLQLPEFPPLCTSSLGIENWEMSWQRVSLVSRTDVSFSPFFLRRVSAYTFSPHSIETMTKLRDTQHQRLHQLLGWWVKVRQDWWGPLGKVSLLYL